MRFSEGYEITSESAAHKFGGDRMAEYLHSHLDWLDEQTGDCQDYGVWIGRFGRRILTTDQYGFVNQYRCASVNEALREFAAEETAYWQFLDTIDE